MSDENRRRKSGTVPGQRFTKPRRFSNISQSKKDNFSFFFNTIRAEGPGPGPGQSQQIGHPASKSHEVGEAVIHGHLTVYDYKSIVSFGSRPCSGHRNVFWAACCLGVSIAREQVIRRTDTVVSPTRGRDSLLELVHTRTYVDMYV